MQLRCIVGAILTGEHAVSAPGSGTLDAGEFGAVPVVASLEVVDCPSEPVRHLILLRMARGCSNLRRAVPRLLTRNEVAVPVARR